MAAALLSAGAGAMAAQTPTVPARAVPLLRPAAIAYDSAGNLYIAESQRHTVRKVDLAGNISAFAGDGTQGFSGDSSPAATAQLDSPSGLAIDSTGTVYVSDSRNHRIRRIDSSGHISTVAGSGQPGFSGDHGPALAASLNLPQAISIDGSGRNLFIADTQNHRVRHIDLFTGTIDTVAGTGEQGFSGDGGPALSAALDSPESLALDAAGNLYIADTHNGRIRRVLRQTGIINTLAGTATAPALPSGVAVDAAGNIFIADARNNQVTRVGASSGAVAVAGTGAQGFAGDGGAAVLAQLDAPHALALSPAGLVTVADTGNQRVRQLGAAASPDTLIQTVAGLGTVVPGALSLSAATVVEYGSGSLTATLSSSTGASGAVTFLEAEGSATISLGTSNLASNTATISLAQLSVGQHRLMATYAGDTTHLSAQSPAALLTISPRAVVATANSVAITYGGSLPTLTGSLSGVLPQDASKVGALFTSTAAALSPVGSYPVTVALTGDAAKNYALQQPTPAAVVISQAASSARLTDSSTTVSFTGTLRVAVLSATSGTPSGTVTLVDGTALLQRTTLGVDGSALFSGLSLSSGAHALVVAYAGDRNFLPSTSPTLIETIAPPAAPIADFTLNAAQPVSQTLITGGSVAYTFNLQMINGGLSSPIVLSVAGQPPFTRLSFSPGYVPPGGPSSSTVVLTVSAGSSAAMRTPGHLVLAAALAASLPFLALVLPWISSSRRQRLPPLTLAFVCLVLSSLALGCGDRTNSGQTTTNPLQSYALTVTGTATDYKGSPVLHTATVTLQMNASQ